MRRWATTKPGPVDFMPPGPCRCGSIEREVKIRTDGTPHQEVCVQCWKREKEKDDA